MNLSDKELKRLEFAKSSVHVTKTPIIAESARIHSTALVGVDGFGAARDTDGTLVKINHRGTVVIGENVVIRSYCTIDRGTVNDTEIGEGTCLDHGVHIAHNVKLGKYNTLAAHCIIEGSCEVGDYNTFGAGVIMQRKTKIGSNCTIGSGSIITKNFGDNCVIVGNPARLLRSNDQTLQEVYIRDNYPMDCSYEKLKLFTWEVSQRFGVSEDQASEWITKYTT